jgi:Tol biopolymer transport system component
VLDFGLAKMADSFATPSDVDIENSPTLTMHAPTEVGMILGTAAYMSPEQARGKPVDKRADIWAFGVVLYEVLTADRAFGAETVPDILAAVLTREIDLSKVPERVRPMLMACLEREPRKRLRDIGDVWRLLGAVPAAQAPAVEVKRKNSLGWPIAAGVALLAAAALAFAHFTESAGPAPSAVRFRLALPDRVTFANRGVMLLSPDGKHLLFPALGRDGERGLWMHSLDSLDSHPVTGIDAPQSLAAAWSPDSKSFIVVDAQNRLQRVDIDGSKVDTITTLKGDFAGAAWTKDGTLLFGTSKGIVQMPVTGGEPRPVTQTREGETAHLYPALLPDGRHFVYLRLTNQPQNSTLAIASVDAAPTGQSTKTLLSSPLAPVIVPGSREPRLFFLKGDALVAQAIDVANETLRDEPVEVGPQVAFLSNAFPMVAASANGRLVYRPGNSTFRLQPTWFTRSGENRGPVGNPNYTGVLVLSPDSSRAALSLPDGQTQKLDIWLMDTTSGTTTRLTFDPAIEQQPVWSRDGKRVAYRSSRDGGGIYIRNTDGSGGEELVFASQGPATNLTDWSKDGRYLVFHRNAPETGWDEWILPLDGTRKAIPIAQTKGSEQGARFSPDGRYVAYVGSGEGGRREIYVQEVKLDGSGAGMWMVSKGAVGMARWRADGKELIYLAPDSTIMAVDVSLSPVFRAGQPRPLFQLPTWFLRTRPDAGAIADMTPDGQRFLFAMPEGGGQDAFTVVLNSEQLTER